MADQRYRFGPLERRGLLLGLGLGQLAWMLGGAAAAVIILAASTSPLAVVLSLSLATGCVVLAVVPLAGRTADEWTPIVIGWLRHAASGERRSLAQPHQRGHVVSGAALHPPASDPPPPLRGLRILSATLPSSEARIGVVKDATTATYTAVIALRGTGFTLLDDHDKAGRLAWWGGVLDGLSRDGSALHRLQWVERAIPDAGDALRAYLDERTSPDDTTDVVESYRELVASAASVTQRHEVFLAVQMHGGRARRAIRRAGGGDRGACAVLGRELSALWSHLSGGDVGISGVLTPRHLATALRAAGDPSCTDIAEDFAWPSATVVSWSHYRTDGAVHATYWVREWPRTDVGADVLAPLLLQTAARRTVAMTMEVEPPLRAQRAAEAALTADLADDDLRRRAGFISGFRRQREQDNVVRRGEEIAERHASVRFSAYVTVTAATVEELEDACADVEHRAQQAQLHLQRLVGEQDVAWTYTLPLGRGLR
jgi:hypothetical protein